MKSLLELLSTAFVWAMTILAGALFLLAVILLAGAR